MNKEHGGRVRRSPWRFLFALLMALAPAILLAGPAGAQGSVVWQQYDVDIDVRENGSVHVLEDQVVRFNGTFSTGFADIPLGRVEDLQNLSIAVGTGSDLTPATYVDRAAYDEEPATFTYSRNGNTLNIDYAFAPTTGGGTRHIQLAYDVLGALRVYEDLDPPNQQLWWMAISTEVTDVAPVESSTVTVTLPEPVPADEVVAAPDSPGVDGATWTWSRDELGSGDNFEVRLQFPPITAATEPAWQQADDQARQEAQEQEEKSAVAGTALFGLGLLILIGGGLVFTLLWFARGRDPHVGTVAEYIADPPDDLSPGAAGTLVDESVEVRDVLATVLDLANRGAIRIHEAGKEEGVFGYGGGFRHEFELVDRSKATRSFEDQLLDAMFGLNASPGKTVSMSEFQATYRSCADVIAKGFYDELVSQGYFAESPEATRNRWSGIAIGAPVAIVVAAVIITNVSGYTSGWLIFPVIAAIIIAVFASFVARRMPSRTRAGAEAAAKWEAFKRYLEDIDERENLDAAKDIFERYLPYATAFGLERSFVQKFAAAGTALPGWFAGGAGTPVGPGRPIRRHRRTLGVPWVIGMPGPYSGGQASAAGGSGGGSGDSTGGGGVPGLQEMSEAGGRSLQGGSDSFFDMLNTASHAFGAGGGGTRGSFGSFGGAGGFSGGGGFGGFGGGGGGGRGFG